MNQPEHGSLDWVKICEKSSKVITFIDLAGHERYLKTTVFGMTGHAPDFGMLMVSFYSLMSEELTTWQLWCTHYIKIKNNSNFGTIYLG